jgi:thiol-disulfide isomerase/thioredoxin
MANVRLILICLLLALGLPALAEQIKLDSLTAGARTYKKVTVLGFNDTDVYFTHSQGISNVRLKYLEPELQKLFLYDAQVAAEAERQQAEDNRQFQKQVGTTAETTFKQNRVAERRLQMTTEANLADPLSDKSPIGLAMPELRVERWIGDKPETRGRFQLIYLWAPWSHPSRRFLPDVNALAAKFNKEIAFAGLVSEAGSDPETDAGVRADFATGIDPSEKFLRALGVTSLPQIVLADPKGIVRYLGHPAALTEKSLQELVAKFAQ